MTEPKLPNPGPGRFWVIEHQPNKKTAPVRIELREKIVKDSDKALKAMSKLIGFEDSVADAEQIYNKASQVVIRAGHIDRFVGTWNGESS